jgi:hypothetical protein
MFLCPFSFGHCNVCTSIYGFWISLLVFFCYLQLESNQGSGDDTALNVIKLLCGTSTERDDNGYTITTGMGNFGNWYGSFTKCQPGEFLTAFRLQVEPNQGVI